MSYTYSYISDALSSGLLFGVFSGVPTTLAITYAQQA